MGASQGGLNIFYIDASIPEPVRVAVAGVRKDVLYAGGPDAPAVETDDDVWLPLAGAGDWIVIHRDGKIRYRPREREALLDSGARTFCLTHAGSYVCWQTLRLLAARWPAIEQIADSEAGPYIQSVTWEGVKPLKIPSGG
jgi:hypothetical protein